MKKFKILLMILLAFTLLSTQVQSNELRFTIGSAFEPEHVVMKVAEKWAEILDERTEGRIQAEVLGGGILGGEEELTDLVSAGTIQVHADGPFPVFVYGGEYNLLVQFALQDFGHVLRYYHPEEPSAGTHLAEIFRTEANQMFLAPFWRGQRQFTANKPVRTPEDVVGMKLRLPGVAAWLEIWREIGAIPTAIPLPELYTSLATGAADASEGEPEQLWGYSLYEVQDYVSLTNHYPVVGALACNYTWFHSLSPEDQQIIRETAVEAAVYGTEFAAAREVDLINRMEEAGATIVETDYEAFYEAALPALERIFEDLALSALELRAIRDWDLPGTLGWDKIEDAYYRGREKALK